MSDLFHKSVYTSRAAGYKYRTLSTNTGDKKRRDTKDDNLFDRKLKELKQAINSRVETEVGETQLARDSIRRKVEKIDNKIDSILELQNTVITLREDLSAAEASLLDMVKRANKLELALAGGETFSLRTQEPIGEEEEIETKVTSF